MAEEEKQERKPTVYRVMKRSGRLLGIEIDTIEAASAEKALEAASQANEVALAEGESFVAVPISNWTERIPVVEMVPKTTLVDPAQQSLLPAVEEGPNVPAENSPEDGA